MVCKPISQAIINELTIDTLPQYCDTELLSDNRKIYTVQSNDRQVISQVLIREFDLGWLFNYFDLYLTNISVYKYQYLFNITNL